VFSRVTRRNGTILAIKEEIPVYKFLGVDVRQGLEYIQGYLWDNLFNRITPRKDFDKLWEQEFKPLAERALADTYKVFYYFDPKDAVFISNDASLIEGMPSGGLKIAFIRSNLKRSSAEAIEARNTSDLRRNAREILGWYFVKYAIDKLEDIVARYGNEASMMLGELYEGYLIDEIIRDYPDTQIVISKDTRGYQNIRSYVDILATSVKAEKDTERPDITISLNHREVIFCFACREETLENIYHGSIFEPYLLNVNRFRETLEALGYKPEILDVREVNVEEVEEKRRGILDLIADFTEIKGKRGRKRLIRERRALGVLRAEKGTCVVFLERDTSKDVRIDAVSVPCIALDEVVEDARRRLEERVPLRLGAFLEEAYLGNKIEEFTDDDRARIAHEYYRMKRDKRWHGKVDLGKWDVYILNEDDPFKDTILVIRDKETRKVYATPLKFWGTLQDAEKWMESNKELLREWLEYILSRGDVSPELVELMSAIFMHEDLKR